LESRPCDFQLGYLEGAVFIDFKKVDHRIQLIRISFDEFGCCEFGQNSKKLSLSESRSFLRTIEKAPLNQSNVKQFVIKLIRINIDQNWNDALIHYGLL
jgi:hypothetical protein